jgi:hypothetical protein
MIRFWERDNWQVLSCLKIHHYKFLERNPYPPVSYVMHSPIWSWPEYTALREKLLQPIPAPMVLEGDASGMVTIDAAARTLEEGVQTGDRYESFI